MHSMEESRKRNIRTSCNLITGNVLYYYLLILLLFLLLCSECHQLGDSVSGIKICDNLNASMSFVAANESYLSTSILARDGAKYPFWIHCYVGGNNPVAPFNSYSLSNLTSDSAHNETHPELTIRNDRYEYLLGVAQKCESHLLKRCQSFRLGLLSQESSKCPLCGSSENCDNVNFCKSDCGQIKSISYPLNYVNNHRCRWSIKAPMTYYVNLTIIDFDIPSANNATKLGTCIFDYLTLIDGYTGKRLGCYCNENLPPPYIVSPWNELIIQFDTNSETTGRGFYFQYEFMKLELGDQIKRQLKPSADGGNGSVDCPPGWQYFRSSCYKAYNELEPLQWYDAENKCKAHGESLDGHLVSILDKEEMLVIHYMLTNVWRSARYRDYYIGLIDVSREGVYRWSDSNPMSYTDWELKPMLLEEETPAQPDGGAYEDCTIIRYKSFSRTPNWHDVPCSLGKHYHSHLEKGNQVSFRWDYVNSYICKSDTLSISRSKVRQRLFSNEFVPYLIQSGHLIRHLANSNTSGNKPMRPAVVANIMSHHRAAASNASNGLLATGGDQTIGSAGNQSSRFYLSMLDDNRYFVCDNLEVISVVLVCDGQSHCRDGSDESVGCDQNCHDWQYKCANGRCISMGFYCNFVDDCGDGSDESRCERHRCKLNEFRCQSGQCIMAHQRCDLLTDCSDASDEGKLCTVGSHCNSASTFQCYNGNCIPQYAVCDFQIDCPGKFHEDEDAVTCDVILKSRSLDYKFYAASTNYHNSPVAYYQAANQEAAGNYIKKNLFKCTSGNMIDNGLRCLYEIDRYGYQIGCRDVSHLNDCADFHCPARDYVKCANSYCIPWRYICDGKYDCIQGEDEVGCQHYKCPGQYKCANTSTSCILLHQLCDGQRQCPMGDDEWFCDLQCPPQCDCIGQSVNCRGANLSTLPGNYIAKSVRKLDLSYNRLGPNLSTSDFSNYLDLGELILNHNGIEVLTPRKFVQLRNLYKLDLSNNQIHSVKKGAFAGLRRVTQLLLESNPELVVLEPEAFLGLSSLQMLNISSSRILTLKKHTFLGLTSLRHLFLRSNMIVEIEDLAFDSLSSLVSLDMRDNEIRYFTKAVFNDLKSLRNLSTDSFKFCCLLNHQIRTDRCLPLPDEISDCEDLLSSASQTTCIWVAGIVACIGNSIVIVWRYRDRGQEREPQQVNSTLLLSLGFADLLMGIYLITIAIVDSWYKGRYIENADNWRESWLCQLCGFLSTVSIEVSVFTLVFMAYNRYTEICIEGFSRYKLTLDRTWRLVLCSWLIALTIATLPLLIRSYFRGQFYSRSGVCLAFQITNQKNSGWQYSIVVFQGFYLVAFVIIATCYCFINQEISAREIRNEQANHQVKILLILFISFAAWSPTIILRLVSWAGIAIPRTVYSWIAVLVLPVNSAINPMIYTIPNIKKQIELLFQNHRAKQSINFAMRAKQISVSGGVGAGSVGGVGSVGGLSVQQVPINGKNTECQPLMVVNLNQRNQLASRNCPPGYLCVKQFIRTTQKLDVSYLVEIALAVVRDLEAKHRESIVYTVLNLDSVFVCDRLKFDDGDSRGQGLSVFIADRDGYRVKRAQCSHKGDQKAGPGKHQAYHWPHKTPNDCECYDVDRFGDILFKLIQLYNSRKLDQSDSIGQQQQQQQQHRQLRADQDSSGSHHQNHSTEPSANGHNIT